MNPEDATLRRAFAADSERRAPGEECPAPDRLWAAATGELPAAERRALIDHTSRCPACAEDFRLVFQLAAAASALQAGAPEPPSARVLAGPWRRLVRHPMAISLAATLLVGVFLAALWSQLGKRPEVYRGGESEIVSLLGADGVLDRRAAVLRWKGPAGARYDLTVTTADLQMVARATDLAESSFRLPEDRLAALPAGTRFDWRVVAVLPDGRRIPSPAFTGRLGE